MTVRYLDPAGRPSRAPQPYRPRLDAGLTAPRIALLSNLFIDATPFLDDIAKELSALRSDLAFTRADKGERRNSSAPLPADRIKQLAQTSDAVITAIGHCGSCTAATIRDAAALAEEGTPVVALVTDRFEEAARFTAQATGLPDLPLVLVPHPVAGLSAVQHRALARAAAPAILDALLNGGSAIVQGQGKPG